MPTPDLAAQVLLAPDPAVQSDIEQRLGALERLYHLRDYQGAHAAAAEFLAELPGNLRALRVGVITACALGDEAGARAMYQQLPDRHQRQMARRCTRFKIDLSAPSAAD